MVKINIQQLRRFIFFSLITLTTAKGFATTYYVSPGGNDIYKGTQWFRPLFSIQKAHDLAEAGDTIMVMNGEYINYSSNYNTHITKSGTADKWIIYKNYPGHKPVIRIYKEYGFYLQQVSYISIEGFSFKEPKLPIDSFTLSRKIGIAIEGSEINLCRNIRIYNNDFSYCPTAGLLINYFDYVKVQYNRFFRNATQRNAYGALVMMNGLMSGLFRWISYS